MERSAKKLRKTFLRLDLFGEPVGFTIDGSGTRKSFLGLFLSLCIIGTMIPYSFKKFDKLQSYDDVTLTSYVENSVKSPTDRTTIDNYTVGFGLANLYT